MSSVRIVTDSASDLTDEEVAEHGIGVVPLSIRFGAEEFVDRVELTVEEFYRRLDGSDDLPETAAPSPGAFEKEFRRMGDEGASGVVCINLSGSLSATMQSAQNAAQACAADLDVRVVDSRTITGGLCNQVLAASAAARDGASLDEIETLLASCIQRTRVFGALDTLANLKKGGRIGGAQALIGSALAIKPILDLSSGEVEAPTKQRTRKKAFRWLCKNVADAGPIERLSVLHGLAPDVDVFLEMLGEHVDTSDVRVGPIGAVIGAHGGPRVVGVAYQVAP